MRAFGSLSNRLFLMCVLLSIGSIGAAMLFVSARLGREHDARLAARLDETIALVERQRRLALDTATRLARLVADLPKLKAAIATGDAATIAPIVASYREEIGADVLIVSDPDGRALFTAGDVRGEVTSLRRSSVMPSSASPAFATRAHPRGILQIVSVPIVLGFDPVERLGALHVGLLLDDEQARAFRAVTGSELAFAMNGRVLASSLGASAMPALQGALSSAGRATVDVGSARYAWHRHALPSLPGEPAADRGHPVLLVLRSTAEAEATLRSVRVALAVIAVLTALAASGASYLVARTITQPLAGLTSAMREMTRTGDLSRRPLRPVARAWEDEDVRVLAGTFDTLTEAVGRFQQQAAERDRLAALGRLSTVIAHEIRNPLMIVRGALRGLRRQDDAAVVDAATDIEEQVLRLDRVVNDVLDFARPVHLEVEPTSLHAICRTAVEACLAAEAEPPVVLALDPRADTIRTDADRLRGVLVNLIANGRDAVQAATPAGRAGGHVTVRTTHDGSAVTIEVVDTGIGMAPDVVRHAFEPYFTTRRTGTGLGLAIARNVVEGLGGTIDLASDPGVGSTVRITLPQEGSPS